MKSSGIFRIVLLVLFILFAGVYLVGNSGYYDYDVTFKTRLTEQQIKEFEEDIKNGEVIDVDSYLELNEKNYDNKISKTTLDISRKISITFDKAITFIFEKLNDVMMESK